MPETMTQHDLTFPAVPGIELLPATEETAPETAPAISMIPVALIRAGNNDRKHFDPVALAELADSIRASGLLQPPTVRQMPGGWYRIVCGERRFRACTQILAWETVPVIVRDMTDLEESLAMLAENTGRRDLDPMEEARGYQERIDQFGLTEREIADAAGVSVSLVQRRLKLLGLRDDLQHLVRTKNLTLGMAEIIAGAGLDGNFQMLAFNLLKENPRPSPDWLRGECSKLLSKQSQSSMFDAPLFASLACAVIEETKIAIAAPPPPHPRHNKPVINAKGAANYFRALVKFWLDAGNAWDARADLPKHKERAEECRAAAAAVAQVITK
jgi:ParB/RepB/Spo0J family partition protein